MSELHAECDPLNVPEPSSTPSSCVHGAAGMEPLVATEASTDLQSSMTHGVHDSHGAPSGHSSMHGGLRTNQDGNQNIPRTTKASNIDLESADLHAVSTGVPDDASATCRQSHASAQASQSYTASCRAKEGNREETVQETDHEPELETGLETVAVRRVVVTVMRTIVYPAVFEFIGESNRILRRCDNLNIATRFSQNAAAWYHSETHVSFHVSNKFARQH